MEQIGPRLKSWATILDPVSRQQAVTTSGMPFIYPHVALMPDAHLGKGATVGSVIPTLGAVIPAAVGVDIGCGMIAVRTQLTAADLPSDRRAVRVAIEDAVPLSAGRYNTAVTRDHTRERIADLVDRAQGAGVDPARYAATWQRQLGTLGSGNHFIEVSLDEEDRVWLFLHSGSRGVGNRVAQHHIAVAQRLARQWRIPLPDRDLAYLVEGTDEFAAYLRDLGWAQHFALLNREEMMDRVVTCVQDWVGGVVEPDETVDCHHNYTARERHFGKDVWVSRKGAIDAAAGVPGLIPGSMGTASYVVTGRGNRLSLCSAPHGAGRNHSRTAARRLFDRADLDRRMSGIAWGRSNAFLDEHPDAYKDIDQVIADAAELVEIRHTLRQIVNVKGD